MRLTPAGGYFGTSFACCGTPITTVLHIWTASVALVNVAFACVQIGTSLCYSCVKSMQVAKGAHPVPAPIPEVYYISAVSHLLK
eukprot:5583714-Prymnesium_polylepis.1